MGGKIKDFSGLTDFFRSALVRAQEHYAAGVGRDEIELENIEDLCYNDQNHSVKTRCVNYETVCVY